MARLSIQSERVKHLVDTQVLPLLLAVGNVAALTKLLNDTLQDSGIEGRLHPCPRAFKFDHWCALNFDQGR